MLIAHACDTVLCVRDAERGEATKAVPTLPLLTLEGCPKDGVVERSEVRNHPLSLLIGGKGGYIPPNRREGWLYSY